MDQINQIIDQLYIIDQNRLNNRLDILDNRLVRQYRLDRLDEDNIIDSIQIT